MSERLAWPAAFVVGIALAIALFLRAQPPAPPGEGQQDLARRAAAAHAAAGVSPRALPGAASSGAGSAGGDLTAGFEARVHALTRRVGGAPDDRDLRLELARLLHDGHRPGEAVAHYRAAVELDPDEAQAYYDLAAVLVELEEWDQAEAVLLRRRERAPDDAVALYDLGAIRANRGDEIGAVRWWEQAEATAADPDLRRRIREAITRVRGGEVP